MAFVLMVFSSWMMARDSSASWRLRLFSLCFLLIRPKKEVLAMAALRSSMVSWVLVSLSFISAKWALKPSKLKSLVKPVRCLKPMVLLAALTMRFIRLVSRWYSLLISTLAAFASASWTNELSICTFGPASV